MALSTVSAALSERAALLDPLAFTERRPGRVAFSDAMEFALIVSSVGADRAVASTRRPESSWMSVRMCVYMLGCARC